MRAPDRGARAAWWPAVVAFLFPVLQLPPAVDGYVLPRVMLLLVGGAVGLALCLRGRTAPGVLRDLRWPALAVGVAAAAALAGSIAPWASLAGQYLRYESALVRVGYLLLFGVTAVLLAGAAEQARRRVVSWFLAGAAVAAAEGGWEWLAGHSGLPGGLDRPDGNLGNAGLLGVVEAMAVPLLVGRILRPGGLRWLPVLGLALIGLAASSARSAWVGALLGTLVVLGLRLPRRHLPIVAGAGVVLLLAAAAVVLGPLRGLNSDPYTLRLELWSRTLPLIAARPLLGWGEDTFGLAFGAYSGGFLPGVTFDRAHSELLDLAAAQGLLGVAASAWFGGAFLAGMLRQGRWRVEEAGALLAALLAYTVWAAVNFDWVPATGPLWLLLGVCRATGWGALEIRPLSVRWRAAAVGATLVAAAAAIVFGVLPVTADLAYHSGGLEQAVRLDPLQARYHRAHGERLVQQGRTAAGAAELRRAGDLGDDSAGTWLELANAESRLGRPAAARDALARARALDPSVITP